LEGGRFATYDLNDLYRRVINRNNRLKNLLQMHTPEVIVRNEKRMLQEAVDALLDNGRHGRPVTGSGNRPLKSLADMLKGKQGRFRQNLLGKRVDYSGRSVIVVGPELKLHQAGLPKKMALTLFEPFIIRRMRELGYIHTVRSAKKMIERGELQVWDILDEVTKGHPILLNRAPTLHRLSIQAFEPVLIEGNAIRLHPLVCTAYNADFDGDQMAVHVPLSNEAQLEASMLMLSSHNIFYPSNGKPICTPTQDIVLGCYYLCFVPKKKFNAVEEDKLKRFNSIFDVISSFERGVIGIHEPVLLRNPDYGTKGRPYGDPRSKWIKTTAGRCVFNELWPPDMGFYNDFINKSSLGDIISAAYARLGRAKTVKILDDLKDRGYFFATRSGFSIGITDMVIPDEKERVLRDAEKEIEKVRKRFNDRVITEVERYNQSVDIWTHAGNSIANALFRELQQSAEEDRLNPVWAMLDSKARGSRDQIRQLAGMRGLMAKPSGDIIEHPIRSCFREGLSVLEFFISSHGARKGLADTALKTADSGYLTRKLVDVAHDVICVEEDCHTTQGITVSAIREGTQDVLPLKSRIVGRFAADDIVDPTHRDPSDTRYLVMAGEEITSEIADKIIDAGIERVTIRSVLTCRSKGGVCAKCYGRNLASDVPTRPGDAIGIIAAQSIGEPGTQLTMRTFHVGGVAHSEYKIPQIKVHHNGILKLEDARYVTTKDGKLVVLNKSAILSIVDKDGIEQESHNLVLGAIVQKDVDSEVSAGEVICVWDPYNLPIISEFSGTVSYIDLVEGATTQAEINEATGKTAITVLEHREDLFPQIAILDDDGERLAHYNLPPGTQVMVEEGQKV
ncbi:MAG: DNA-directed RNA polymerase subunit beta', partial [Lentisphaerae bacterium]